MTDRRKQLKKLKLHGVLRRRRRKREQHDAEVRKTRKKSKVHEVTAAY